MWSRSALFGILIWSNLCLGAEDKILSVPQFLQKWSDSQTAFQDAFTDKATSRSAADRFLRALVSSTAPTGKFEELSLIPGLKSSLLSLINEGHDEKTPPKTEVSFEDLQKLLSEKPEKLSNEIKKQLASLVMVHLQKNNGGSETDKEALKELVVDYLKVTAQLSPNEIIPLSESWKKQLGIKDEEAKEMTAEKLAALVQEKGIPSEKEGLEMFSSLLDKSLANPEGLGVAFQPVAKQLFNSIFVQADRNVKAELSNGKPSDRAGAQQIAQDRLDQQRQKEAENAHREGGSSGEQARQPRQGGGGGFNNSGGGGAQAGQAGPGGSIPQSIPGNNPQMKSCIDLARKTELNVPIRIPGGECASTAVSSNPTADQEAFSSAAEKDISSKVTITLSTALHCVEGLRNLSGEKIRISIKGQSVIGKVVADVNPDGVAKGKAVANGNADMAVLKLEILARDAKKLSLARVPSEGEISKLFDKEIPVALYQNTKINVDKNGPNKGVLAATGAMERGSNFLKFNAINDLNQSNNFDEQIIKPGDSGGTAVACKYDEENKAKELIYLGAVSHVNVFQRGTGLVGGVSSGNSLANLSNRIRGSTPSGTALASVAGGGH